MLKLPDGQARVRSGYEAWSLYLQTNAHFKARSKYDAIKFNWCGIKTTEEKYQKSPARWHFESLLKRLHSRNEVIGYFVANILAGESWPLGMTMVNYEIWAARLERLTYQFKSDMTALRDLGGSFDELFTGTPPQIFQHHLAGLCSLETLVILNQILGYTRNSVHKYSSPISPLDMTPEMSEQIEKYQRLLSYSIDSEKFRKLALGLYTEIQHI